MVPSSFLVLAELAQNEAVGIALRELQGIEVGLARVMLASWKPGAEIIPLMSVIQAFCDEQRAAAEDVVCAILAAAPDDFDRAAAVSLVRDRFAIEGFE